MIFFIILQQFLNDVVEPQNLQQSSIMWLRKDPKCDFWS